MERSFSSVIDTLPGLVWTALPDGRADFVNSAGASTPASASTKPAVLVGERRASRRSAGSCWWTGDPSSRPASRANLEARLRRFDGEYRWFLFRTSPIADASGEVVGWCGVNTEIEDRKRAQEAALASGPTLQTDRRRAACDGHADDPGGRARGRQSAHARLFRPEPRGAEEPARRLQLSPGRPRRRPRPVETLGPDRDALRPRGPPAPRGRGLPLVPHAAGPPCGTPMAPSSSGICCRPTSTTENGRKPCSRARSGCSRWSRRALPLAEVLEALCRVVEDAAPGRLCSVLWIDPDGVPFPPRRRPQPSRRLQRGSRRPDHGPQLRTVRDGGEPENPGDRRGRGGGPALGGVALARPGDRATACDRAGRRRSCRGDDTVIGVFALYQTRAGRPSRASRN